MTTSAPKTFQQFLLDFCRAHVDDVKRVEHVARAAWDAALDSVPALVPCDYPPPQPVFGPRSPRWAAVRREHVKYHPACAACGQRDHVEVHHVEPYHLRPELELVAANLVTLCDRPGRSCHFSLGHLWDWNRANPFVREVAAMLYGQLQEATKGDK
jgi:hypothetical protein